MLIEILDDFYKAKTPKDRNYLTNNGFHEYKKSRSSCEERLLIFILG